jgi:hypothetical protein
LFISGTRTMATSSWQAGQHDVEDADAVVEHALHFVVGLLDGAAGGDERDAAGRLLIHCGQAEC